ncbi:hypothetical protein NYR60_06515 [Actinobacillus genomosp. 2]|uniref:hypothetical protein n=1 Tax=Actinobacillus genomosp. 2 TaxID=230709 RepID=UPI002442AB08|nr:hypothetical protein [Actinobacillus genomosp. 2]WGE31514.1 hypothetical protein NYR60_06515 [Actinobacillus genomosp. 2]
MKKPKAGKASTPTAIALKSPTVPPKAKGKATPPTTNGSHSGGKLTLTGFYQMDRQFELMKGAVERCKRDFPDCWHMKENHRSECLDLAERLQTGLDLWQEIEQIAPLTQEQKAKFKAFKRGAVFFISRLKATALHIEQVANSTIKATFTDEPQVGHQNEV